MSEVRKFQKKLLLLGDGAVGKTSLIRRFVTSNFDDKYIVTIGTKVSRKEVKVIVDGLETIVNLTIWDVLGQKGYSSVQETSYRGSEGAILVCDITRKETLQSLEDYWIPSHRLITGPIPIIFAANKIDLMDKAQFTKSEFESFAKRYNSEYIFTSAKTGENVEEAFTKLATHMVKFKPIPRQETQKLKNREIKSIIDAADMIIDDFCENFGGHEAAMPIVRKQFEKVNMSVTNPTKEGLIKIVEALSKIESDFKPQDVVRKNRTRRMLWLEKIE